MPSIVNGLFSGRSGISSHGTAIAVIGDNISNASTVGFKTQRAEFQDLIAGGQTSGKVVGSGSSISAVSNVFEQGTLEFTGRTLDLAVDGNGLFVVQTAGGGSRFYTRAGNFSIDAEGFIINPNGYRVLGFPAGGTGALEEINVNSVSQSSVASTEINIAGNVNASSTYPVTVPTAEDADGTPPGAETVTYADLNNVADFSTVVTIFDTLGAQHNVTFYFFHTAQATYTVGGYVNSEEVDASGSSEGFPRLIGSVDMDFDSDGSRNNFDENTADITATVPWNNGSSATQDISINFDPFTMYASPSNVLSIAQDGKGIGAVGNISIEKNGDIFALLDNGQAATIGKVGLVNFSNPEGLVRIGGNLLQQSPASGEPVIGKPQSGTFGSVQSGNLELSTVDIANEFVKLITIQRGFQANSRIITTINSLLNEVIQLV